MCMPLCDTHPLEAHATGLTKSGLANHVKGRKVSSLRKHGELKTDDCTRLCQQFLKSAWNASNFYCPACGADQPAPMA